MRLIFIIVFFLGFLVFGILKAIGSATKSAYNAVFNPNASDEKVKGVLAQVYFQIAVSLRENPIHTREDLRLTIPILTELAQETISQAGYPCTKEVAFRVVVAALENQGHATAAEIRDAVV